MYDLEHEFQSAHDSPGVLDNRAFQANRTTRKETTILPPCIPRLLSTFRSWSRREVVDDVEETEAFCEQEHNLVPFFDTVTCVSRALREVFL